MINNLESVKTSNSLITTIAIILAILSISFLFTQHKENLEKNTCFCEQISNLTYEKQPNYVFDEIKYCRELMFFIKYISEDMGDEYGK